MKNTDRELEELIPISVSVKMLEDAYPHLRGIRWNEKQDEVLTKKARKNKENGISR